MSNLKHKVPITNKHLWQVSDSVLYIEDRGEYIHTVYFKKSICHYRMIPTQQEHVYAYEGIEIEWEGDPFGLKEKK